MDTATILSHVDHTLLKPEATWEQIKTLCDEAMEFGCATVCIPPSFVKQAAAYVQGNLKICTVIGFPNGYNTTAAKIFETKDAVENGASEIDMVINNGMVKDRQWDDIAHEIAGIKAACLGRRAIRARVRRRYPKLVKGGILTLTIGPIAAAILWGDADHMVQTLVWWTICVIAIVTYVIVVEYLDYRYQKEEQREAQQAQEEQAK